MSTDANVPTSALPESQPEQLQPQLPEAAGTPGPVEPTEPAGPPPISQTAIESAVAGGTLAYPPGAYPQIGYPPAGFPPPPPPPPLPRRRRRPPTWSLIAGGVAVAGLVAGLLVWAPWIPSPQAPTALQVSSTSATTAFVSWAAPKGGATPSRYDILRDGKQMGTVPGSVTSWTDSGLSLGSKYYYEVITEGNGEKSAPTVRAGVTTMVPPPAVVTETGASYTTVTLHWTPPQNAPTPDTYTVYDTSGGQTVVDTISGARDTYTVTQLVPGDDYSFAVSASWGNKVSGLSIVADAPPLAAPMTGDTGVDYRVTSIEPGSTGLKVGDTWESNWTLTPNCTETRCTLVNNGSVIAGRGKFTMTLVPTKGGYQGQAANVKNWYSCGGVQGTLTVTLNLHPASGGITNGSWTSWSGKMTLAAPYQAVGSGYCPAGEWTIAVSNAS